MKETPVKIMIVLQDALNGTSLGACHQAAAQAPRGTEKSPRAEIQLAINRIWTRRIQELVTITQEQHGELGSSTTLQATEDRRVGQSRVVCWDVAHRGCVPGAGPVPPGVRPDPRRPRDLGQLQMVQRIARVWHRLHHRGDIFHHIEQNHYEKGRSGFDGVRPKAADTDQVGTQVGERC